LFGIILFEAGLGSELGRFVATIAFSPEGLLFLFDLFFFLG
jgi:hypothetical protein